MNNKIEDILNNLEFNVNHTNNWKEPLGLKQETWKQLLNYITNLQQENERLHNRELELSYHLSLYSSEETMLKENKDLQQRIEKAINKLKEIKYDLDYEPWSFYNTEGKILFDLVNILNGRSDE